MEQKENKTAILIFICIAVVLTIITGEIVIRIAANFIPIYNIEMVRYAQTLKQPDPQKIISHIHRPNTSAKLMGVDVILNSRGHRSEELSAEKSTNEKRILFLGASAVFGWGVDQNKTFSIALGENLNSLESANSSGKNPEQITKYKIINAGIGNTNTTTHLEILKRNIEFTKPDHVILGYVASDAIPRSLGNDNPAFRYSYLAAYFSSAFDTLKFKSKSQSLVDYYHSFYGPKNEFWLKARYSILEIKKLSAEHGATTAVMLMPDLNDFTLGGKFDELYKFIEADLKKNDVVVINSFPHFSRKFLGQERSLWVSPGDPHANEIGHAQFVTLLSEYFTQSLKKQ